MARYVVLAFASDKEAEAFIAALGRNEGAPGHVFYGVPHPDDPERVSINKLSENVFVRGLYMKPTQFCECPEIGPFSRGKKFGLWVHAKCGKPTKAWAAGDAWYASLGKNLLPPSPRAPEWRGEGIAHHRFDEATKRWVHVVTGVPWDGGKGMLERLNRGQQ